MSRSNALLQAAAKSLRGAAQSTSTAAASALDAVSTQTASTPALTATFVKSSTGQSAVTSGLRVPLTVRQAVTASGASVPTDSICRRTVPWGVRRPVHTWRKLDAPRSTPEVDAGSAPHLGGYLGRALRQMYGSDRRSTAESAPAALVRHLSAVTSARGLPRVSPGLMASMGARRAPAAAAGAAAGVTVAAASATAGLLGSGGLLTVRTVWRDSRGYEHFQGRGTAWSPHNPRLLYASAAVAVTAVLYYMYCLETVPYTGRRHSIMLVSSYREQWMGKMGFEQFKALARAEHKLLPDTHPDALRVRRLGSAIAAVAADGAGGGSYDHMKGLQWEFAVINDNMVNAAVLPGGKVIVFGGLLRLLGDNDDELAAVMAHEVGHVLARHPAENMSTLNVWLLVNTALRLTLGFALPDVAMYLALILPNSRKNEHEADVIGLRLMARACFDPAAAPSMLDKLHQAEQQQGRLKGGSLPPFLSTHPLTTDRVKLLERDLPEAYKLFDQAGCASSRRDFRRGMEAWLGGAGWGLADELPPRFRSM